MASSKQNEPKQFSTRYHRWDARNGERENLFAVMRYEELARDASMFHGLLQKVGHPAAAIIDQIDTVLAQHYGFTDEELDFIINYDIKYCLGRDAGCCVISGFHSPVEKECLRILLRGEPPLIICPARGLPRRIPPEWETPLTAGRLLILSAFPTTETRMTADLASRRNAMVAALAGDVYVAHAAPGGRLDTRFRRQKDLPLARQPSP